MFRGEVGGKLISYSCAAGLLFARRRQVLGKVFGFLANMNMRTLDLELTPLA